jgi:hypothetical protein
MRSAFRFSKGSAEGHAATADGMPNSLLSATLPHRAHFGNRADGRHRTVPAPCLRRQTKENPFTRSNPVRVDTAKQTESTIALSSGLPTQYRRR